MKKNKNQNIFWVYIGLGNAIVIYLASLFFPQNVVLGNDSVGSFIAVIIVAILLTVFLTAVKPVIQALKVKIKGDLVINIIYAAANIVGIWILARFALLFGLGISSFIVAIVLGAVLSLSQFLLWKTLVGKK